MISDDQGFERIRREIADHSVVLFMKGTPVSPQCGFSAAVVEILSDLGVKFKAVDVLQDPEMRERIKEFSSWPTIPQLYVAGELVGGSDILQEMHKTGELAQLLGDKDIELHAVGSDKPPGRLERLADRVRNWRGSNGHDDTHSLSAGGPAATDETVEAAVEEKPMEQDDAVDGPGNETAGEDPIETGEGLIEDDDTDPELAAKIKDLIETRIKPVASQNGGEVNYRGFKGGIVFLEITGAASELMMGIENMLRHYVPEVEGVADYRDAIPKPGLETAEGKAIRQLLDERINPQVAAHGGHIALVDVQDDTVYIRLEGGCQGCGMADVTLKQGVAKEIQSLVPAITTVLDVTDHAGGDNPYYQPGKGGMDGMDGMSAL